MTTTQISEILIEKGILWIDDVDVTLKWLMSKLSVAFILRIKRAFLIEEQKIVVKVLKAQAQSQKSK